ncbi:TetR/AcrR family transcriptional regulator [Longispora sp. K20-0274]|uniref:TetR/AcrR family transcriptional regulator n=1 Tax=Longispora sp. K20-0274 TaxID=3088255 RepID=UPI003999D1A3
MNIHSVTTGKRETILAAARALFAERTFAGTPMPLVAERAGIGVGTIYRYFPSKEALGNAVFQDAKRTLYAYLAVGEQATSVRDGMYAMWRGLAAFAREHSEAFAFLEHQHHGAYLDADSLALSARNEEISLHLIRLGQQAGEVRDGDPGMFLALVLGAFVGLDKAARSACRPLTDDDIEASAGPVWDLLRATSPKESAP